MDYKEYSITVDEPVSFGITTTEFSQKFCVISFISPEDEIKKKIISDISKFIKFELDSKMNELYKSILADFNILISAKVEEYMGENIIFKDVMHEIKDDLKILDSEFSVNNNLLENSLSKSLNNDMIMDIIKSIDFSKFENNDNVQAIKVKGVFTTITEANEFCNDIRNKVDKHMHIFIGAMNHWLPFNPFEKGIKNKVYNASTNNNPNTSNIQFNSIIQGYENDSRMKDNFLLQQQEYEDSIKHEKIELERRTKAKIEELKKMRASKKITKSN